MDDSSPKERGAYAQHAAADLVLQKIEPVFRTDLPSLANIAIAVLVVVAARNHLPVEALAGWVLLMASAALWRIVIAASFRRSGIAGRDAPRWERRMARCTALQGMLWAMTGLAIARYPMPTEILGIVSMAVCGMLAGATFTLTGSQLAFRAYVIPAGLGPILGLASLAGPGAVVLPAMGLVYMAVVLVWGHAIAKATDERLALAAEKEHLLINLELAQREAAFEKEYKDETFKKLGHELRTPLNSIIGFAELIGAEVAGPIGSGKYKEYAGLVAQSGRHLARLIDEMLSLARSDSVQAAMEKEQVDVAEVIAFCRDLLGPFANTRNVALRLARSGEPIPALSVDPLKLRQVLINLMNNAIHYTPVGGAVEVAIGRRDRDFIEISVSDTGIGMAAEDIPRALRPFNQLEDGKARNPHGKGIGLALSKKFIEMHGGRLEIESARGEGTKITILLPVEGPA